MPPVAGFAHFHLVVEVKTLKAGAGVRSAHVDMKAVWARLSLFASLTGEDRVKEGGYVSLLVVTGVTHKITPQCGPKAWQHDAF